MAGQPKNKITRAEQGKRRRGNTPHLLKNLKQARTPLHKKALFARIASLLTTKGVTAAQKSADQSKKVVKNAPKSGSSVHAPAINKSITAPAPAAAPQKRVPQTQHKGG